MRLIKRAIGRKLTKGKEQELHHVIKDFYDSSDHVDVEEIVAWAESWFGGRSGAWNRDN